MCEYDNQILPDERLRSIIEQIDSPAMLYCETLLDRCVDEYRQLSTGSDDVRYALKACYIPEVAQFIQNKQFGVEVMTVEEARHALACGWKEHTIDFDGCGRDASIFSWSIDKNIHHTLTSSAEIDAYIAARNPCSINSSAGLRLHSDHLKPAVRRFGVSLESIDACITRLNNAGINIDEFKIHGWSDGIKTNDFDTVLTQVVKAAGRHDMSRFRINLGGGNITKAMLSSITSLRELASRSNIDISVVHEPGAALVNRSCLCIADIMDVQDDHVVINCPGNMLPPLDRAEYSAFPLYRKGGSKLYTVSDNLLAFHTICNKEHDLGEVSIGDRIIIENVGAYTYNFTSLIGLTVSPMYWLDADYNLKSIAPFLQ